jgi:protein TonB
MKKILLTSLIIIFSSCVKAQKIDKPKTQTDSVYLFAEVMPEFPGGIQKFNAYLIRHINIPNEAYKNKDAFGRIIIQMIIEKDGSITHVEVINKNKANTEIAQEIVRVFNHSPKWKAGINNKTPVRVRYRFPISCLMPNGDL